MRWRTVGWSVQWGSALVCFLFTLLPYLVIHGRSTPRERAFVVYDADISHPPYKNTVAGANRLLRRSRTSMLMHASRRRQPDTPLHGCRLAGASHSVYPVLRHGAPPA